MVKSIKDGFSRRACLASQVCASCLASFQPPHAPHGPPHMGVPHSATGHAEITRGSQGHPRDLAMSRVVFLEYWGG